MAKSTFISICFLAAALAACRHSAALEPDMPGERIGDDRADGVGDIDANPHSLLPPTSEGFARGTLLEVDHPLSMFYERTEDVFYFDTVRGDRISLTVASGDDAVVGVYGPFETEDEIVPLLAWHDDIALGSNRNPRLQYVVARTGRYRAVVRDRSTSRSSYEILLACDNCHTPRLFGKYRACAREMFDSYQEMNLGSHVAVDQQWTRSYRPVSFPPSGGVQFGPHPRGSEWWHDFSPLESRDHFGSAAVCVRMNVTPWAPSASDNGGVQLSMRGMQWGMNLNIGIGSQTISIATKTGEPDSWTDHGVAPVPLMMPVGSTHEIEAVLIADGTRFVGEVVDRGSGDIASIDLTTERFGPAGPIGLLGWRLQNAAVVTSVAVGTLSNEARTIISQPRYSAATLAAANASASVSR